MTNPAFFQNIPFPPNLWKQLHAWTLKLYVEALSLPILGEWTGGFDGTDYLLRISRIRTASEFRWWMYLPERWLPLLEIISFMAKPFATSDFDDSNPRTTVELDELADSTD